MLDKEKKLKINRDLNPDSKLNSFDVYSYDGRWLAWVREGMLMSTSSPMSEKERDLFAKEISKVADVDVRNVHI